MAFNIRDILSDINKHNGILRTSHFTVMMPTAQVSGAPVVSETLTMAAERVTIPGLDFMTVENTYGGYGMHDRRPTLTQTSPQNCTIEFLVDGNSDIPDFFHQWMRKISGYTGAVKNTDDRDLFEYPINYWVDFDINHYRIDGEQIITYKLIRAFPINMQSIQLDWADQNSLARLTVDFAFHTWTTDRME
jgi:hypothetical protein